MLTDLTLFFSIILVQFLSGGQVLTDLTLFFSIILVQFLSGGQVFSA